MIGLIAVIAASAASAGASCAAKNAKPVDVVPQNAVGNDWLLILIILIESVIFAAPFVGILWLLISVALKLNA